MSISKMNDLDLTNKRVLIREDFNVPIQNGKITSLARIKAALFTIEQAHKAGATVILMSHLGRPKEGQYDENFSLKPVAFALSKLLNHKVKFITDWIDGFELEDNDIALCENVRFLPGEKANDETLAKKMAALADIYVMDAFGSAHRKHASTYGVAKFAKQTCAGPLLDAEYEALTHALHNPMRPLVSIVAGAKVSTKIGVLRSIIELSDTLIVGGGIANTFLAAKAYPMGKSLYEKNLLNEAQILSQFAKKSDTLIVLPEDVVVAKSLSSDAKATIKLPTALDEDDMILDFGPKTNAKNIEILKSAHTIIWNGPIGVFEYEQFAKGTKAIAEGVAKSLAFSIAGGGDTLAAIEKFSIKDDVSYISTGGGAFLDFLQHKTLPAIEALKQ